MIKSKLKVSDLTFKITNPIEMRIALFHLFSTYGEVIQVRMRQT
jgi:hypothetical protein